MNLSTMFIPDRDNLVERLIRAANAERWFAKLPDNARRWSAKRRAPGFGHVPHLLKAKQGDDYELMSAAAQKCIFVHVPKAAGISVANALFGSRAGGHIPLCYYLWLYGAKRFDAYFKFAFVRHPVDRARSAYQFLHAGGLSQIDRDWAEIYVKPYETFDEFVSQSLVRPEVSQALHFRPQVFFLTDPRTGKIGLDFLGKFENIGCDFVKVADRLGRNCQLPHLNKKDGLAGRLDISNESLGLLHEIYRQDLAALDYNEYEA